MPMPDEGDKIGGLLARGECATIEFKSSLRWDYRQQCVNKELTKVAARTLAALMNSQGGSLAIGVDDDHQVLGIEPDLSTLSKQSNDGFELTLRNAISQHLGPSIDPHVSVDFVTSGDKVVALASCSPHPAPVYYVDGEKRELCVRAGNLTRSLDLPSAVAYIQTRWPSEPSIGEERVRELVGEFLATRPGTVATRETQDERTPAWLTVSTRRVLNLYLGSLMRSQTWKRLDIVSPWISDIDSPPASMTFNQFLVRLKADRATAYIVTRPPVDDWHARAIARLAETGRANIALLPELHMKLFTAQTVSSSFAMMGSANFTGKSLSNRELGILISSIGDGASIVRNLSYEAAEIYRHRDRHLAHRAELSA